MGHTLQTFRGQRIRFRDGDLVVAVCVIVDLVHHRNKDEGIVDPTYWQEVETWLDKWYGPGVIPLNLDRFLSTQERVDQTLKLIDAAGERVGTYGASVPGALFNQLMGLEGPNAWGDQESTAILETLEQLRHLLAR
jgi:hypothetical protein